jgi:hypothetical protein
VVLSVLSRQQEPISEITRAKRASSMASVVECPSSKYKVLTSNPSITIKHFIYFFAKSLVYTNLPVLSKTTPSGMNIYIIVTIILNLTCSRCHEHHCLTNHIN